MGGVEIVPLLWCVFHVNKFDLFIDLFTSMILFADTEYGVLTKDKVQSSPSLCLSLH